MTEKIEKHPSFPQPDNIAQVIWRYMDSDKFEWLLEQGRLFMPTADNLCDPLEGSTPRGEIEWWEQEVLNATTDEQLATIAHNRQFLADFRRNFRPRYYVSCWHMNTHENYSMWCCYTKTNRAVAIKTTYTALRKALPIEVLMGVIRYIDYSTDRLPWGNMFECIMHKDINFRYEAEVRAIMTLPPNDELGLQKFSEDHFALTANPNLRVYAPKVDVSTMIEGIVLHPDVSKSYAAKVRKLCIAKGLPAPTPSRETTTAVY
ncbi:hypothetical protein Q1W73_13255 [Asticcacaulis sp. ZE23SCel15]|uniref:hypothetical protein n=1 Tax=Asticcacaulis sp. ZE23SCel15 TaxID=3059027 RepID=UPI00265D84A2|nr:hypothetical protein [Asticcacaulis sp. ZE23SCel15]WKL56635.1 hypothetical protein Q1W73_13255 [Asticcacaulis sp. ZE23SCel15]